MKRSGFKPRTKPMSRGSWSRKDAPLPDTQLRRSRIKSKARPRAPKAEREHMGVVAGLYCIVCRNLRLGESPAEVHHVRFLAGGAQRSGNLDTIPLCPMHHRLGGWGIAYHAGPEEFERRYGTEAELLEKTRIETGIQQLEAV